MIPEWLSPSIQGIAEIKGSPRVVGEPAVNQRRNLRHALWCARNAERRKEIIRKFEQSEARKAYKKRWAKDNPDKRRASAMRRSEHRREYAKAYYLRNREKILARMKQRSACNV